MVNAKHQTGAKQEVPTMKEIYTIVEVSTLKEYIRVAKAKKQDYLSLHGIINTDKRLISDGRFQCRLKIAFPLTMKVSQ